MSAYTITKNGRAVGKVAADGVITTNDQEILGWLNLGVVVFTGGGKPDNEWLGKQLVKPDEDGFRAAFVTALLDNGYEVPAWVTQALA